MKKKLTSIFLSAVIVLGSIQQAYGFDTRYSVSANGNYTFKVQDKAGNESTLVVIVDNIDIIKPTVDTLGFHPAGATEENKSGVSKETLEIVIQASDNLSGVKSVEYQITEKNGIAVSAGWSLYNSSSKPTIADNGEYTVHARCTDNAGNVSVVKTENVLVDKTPPVLEYKLSTTEWTNQPIEITVTATDDLSGIESIMLPDGSKVEGSIAKFSATENKTYNFSVSNTSALTTELEVNVENIETLVTPPKQFPDNQPIPPIEELTNPDNKEFEWTNSATAVDFTSIAPSGIRTYQYRIDGADTPTSMVYRNLMGRKMQPRELPWEETQTPKITIGDEGIHSVQVRSISVANNISDISTYKVKNDFTPPKAKHQQNGRSIVVTAEDTQSGVSSIVCSCGSVTGNTATCANIRGLHEYDIVDFAGNHTAYYVTVSAGGGSTADKVDKPVVQPVEKPKYPWDTAPLPGEKDIPVLVTPYKPNTDENTISNENGSKNESTLIEDESSSSEAPGISIPMSKLQEADTAQEKITDEVQVEGGKAGERVKIVMVIILIFLLILLILYVIYKKLKEENEEETHA